MKRLKLFYLIFVSSLSFHCLTSGSSASQNPRAHKKAKLPAAVAQALEERDALWQKKLIESQHKTLQCVIAVISKKCKEDAYKVEIENDGDGGGVYHSTAAEQDIYDHDLTLIKYLREQKKEIKKQVPSENKRSNKKRKRTKS